MGRSMCVRLHVHVGHDKVIHVGARATLSIWWAATSQAACRVTLYKVWETVSHSQCVYVFGL